MMPKPVTGMPRLPKTVMSKPKSAWHRFIMMVAVLRKNYNLAFSWFNKAAKQDDPRALSYLGSMYEKGNGVPKDLTKALENYQKAADHGVDFAQYNVGKAYQNGIGTKVDLDEAIKYYQMASDQNVAAAHFELARIYLDWVDTPDYDQVNNYGRKAVDQNFVPAFYYLARALDSGDHELAEDVRDADNKDAYNLYQRAIANNQEVFRSYYQLALMYRDGRGVAQNSERAVAIFNSLIKKTANSKDKFDIVFQKQSVEELLKTAHAMMVGEDLPKNTSLAINIFNALTGNSDKAQAIRAAKDLADYFAKGETCRKKLGRIYQIHRYCQQIGG